MVTDFERTIAFLTSVGYSKAEEPEYWKLDPDKKEYVIQKRVLDRPEGQLIVEEIAFNGSKYGYSDFGCGFVFNVDGALLGISAYE